MKKVNSILNDVLEKINPSKEELKFIKESLEEFKEKLEKRIKENKINAIVFVGGSFAKGTLIKKKDYDIDIFVRFDLKYKDENLSKMTANLLKNTAHSVIHGSRDYFRIKIRHDIFFEVVPVLEVKNPKEAQNITDLSYFHVRYIRQKITDKISDDIKLAKVFCHANNVYGAESYIKGFSGYALELLIYHYKSFSKFIEVVSKMKQREIVDIDKLHKDKRTVMLDMNSAKLKSPIILVDPTYRQRNALAALSDETFLKFQKVCRDFIKNPSEKFFETKKIDFEKEEKDAKKKKYEFVVLTTKTDRQEGDIAGSKLLKFHKHISNEIDKFFEIKNSGFEYDDKKSSKSFFAGKSRKEILLQGPRKELKEYVIGFKKEHKNTFEKSGKIFAREKVNYSIKEFIKNWKDKNKKKMDEMSIIELGVE
ncbi:MAG: nucleotidyltransferase domain-containing protein [Nanoarchaeota archaeon]|nr:nucleotidyltransferase domain-containing protein [Nanoarchaeota archaeon]